MKIKKHKDKTCVYHDGVALTDHEADESQRLDWISLQGEVNSWHLYAERPVKKGFFLKQMF